MISSHIIKRLNDRPAFGNRTRMGTYNPKRNNLFRIRNLHPIEHDSEAIAGIDYDPVTQEMQIVFNQRGTYKYSEVEPQVFSEFNGAASRGTYFNMYIRNHGYWYERIG